MCTTLQINWGDKKGKIWKVYQQASDGMINNENTEILAKTTEKDVIFTHEVGKN